MKVLILSNKERHDRYETDLPVFARLERDFYRLDAEPAEMLARSGDAGVIVLDAIATVGRELIQGLPELRLIHSTGVGYNGVDVDAATGRGIPICNCRGVNAGAVAEHTVMLMIMLLRQVIQGDRAVREGRQIQFKDDIILEGYRELGDCRVGLVGLGDIGKATALRLRAFGCEVLYHNRNRRSAQEEEACGVRYVPLEELLERCDLVSLHLPANAETNGMVDRAFLRRMRPDAFLVNTSRGELVDNPSLRQALEEGWIAGAGLDTIHPEPMLLDNPLINLSEDCARRVIYTPHIAGVSAGFFRRSLAGVWENVRRLLDGEPLENVVNGL